MRFPRTLLLLAIALPAAALPSLGQAATADDTSETAAPLPPERVTGAVPAELKAYDETFARFRARMEEFTQDSRAIVDQREREERDKLQLGYSARLTELTDEEKDLRNIAIDRLEAFLTKYPNSEAAPGRMFRLAELYMELANEEWAEETRDYQELEDSTPEDEIFNLPEPPTRDYARSVTLYQKIINEHPSYEYLDGAHYMLGYCFHDELSTQSQGFDASETARTNFQTVVDDFPESRFAIDANFILGENMFFENDVEESVAYFRRVVTKAPEDHVLFDKGLYMLAWSYYKLSDYKEAMPLFTQLLDYSQSSFLESGTESPLKPEAIKYSAISFSDLSQRSIGFDDPEFASYAGEADAMAFEFLGGIGVFRAASPVEIARAWYQSVGEREFESEVIKSLADVLVEQAYYEEAIETYEYIQTQWPDDPNNPDYQFEVARLYMNLPLPDEDASSAALAQLGERYAEGTPWWDANRNNPEAQNRARTYMEQALAQVAVEYHVRAQRTEDPADYSKAADKYAEFLDKFPFADNYYEIEWYLADSLYFAGRYPEAITEYKQLLKATGHPYRDGAQYQLFRSLTAVLTDRNGSVEKLPQDATVERTAEIASGARNVYGLSEDHKGFIAIADTLKKAEFTDADFLQALEDNRSAIYYLPAQVYYEHGDYEEARKRMQEIIDLYPLTDEAAYAAGAIVNSYEADGDLENVAKYAALYNSMRLGADPMLEESTKLGFKNLEEGAKFKLALKLGQNGDYVKSADAFMAYINDYPSSDNYNFALYNAANYYEMGGKNAKASQLFERYIAEFPRDENSKGLYFRIADNYAELLELEKAISYYENLYRFFPGHEDAHKALYMAGFLRTGIGDHKGAAENFETYVRKYPGQEDAEAVYWFAGEQYKLISDKDALSFYKRYVSKFSKTNPDHVIESYHWIAQYYDRVGDKRKSKAAWADVTRNYNRLAAAGTVGPVARRLAAEAEFRDLWAEHQDFMGDAYPKSEEKVVQFLLEDKVAEYQAIEAHAIAMIDTYQDFEYSSAAIYVWGATYVAYSEYLYEAPCPPKFSEEMCWIFEEKLAEKARPIEEKGIARFETNLEKSKTEKRSSVWIDKTIEALNDINPSAYPLEKAEVRGITDASVVPSAAPLDQPAPKKKEEDQ